MRFLDLFLNCVHASFESLQLIIVTGQLEVNSNLLWDQIKIVASRISQNAESDCYLQYGVSNFHQTDAPSHNTPCLSKLFANYELFIY